MQGNSNFGFGLTLFLLAAVIAVAVYVVQSQDTDAGHFRAAPDGQEADLEAIGSDLDGNAVNLADHAGDVILLDFWGTWCPPCQRSRPGLVNFVQSRTGQGLTIIGIPVNDQPQAVRDYISQAGNTWPQLATGNETMAQKYGVSGVPTVIALDRHGNIRGRVNPGDLAGLRSLVDPLLEEAAK